MEVPKVLLEQIGRLFVERALESAAVESLTERVKQQEEQLAALRGELDRLAVPVVDPPPA